MRTRALMVAASFAALVLTGCADPEADTKAIEIDGASSSSTPSPTATRSSTGTLLDLIPPKPERPADARTKAGAIAFADHVFAVIFYAYGQADPQPIRDIADTAVCRGCEQPVQNTEVMAQNDRLLLGTKPIETSKAKVVNVDGDLATVRLQVSYPQQVLVFAESGQAEGKRSPELDELTTVNLRWDDDAWTLLDFSEVKK